MEGCRKTGSDREAGADFIEKIGVRDLVTHAGFMPENPYDPQYAPTVDALCRLAVCRREKGLRFLFETGQETPVTLQQVIEEIGYPGDTLEKA